MARVTVEDCLEHVDGIFHLVKIASKRARRIANGAETLLEDEENDKPTVIALREIEQGLVTAAILTEVVQDYEILDAADVADAAAVTEAPEEPSA